MWSFYTCVSYIAGKHWVRPRMFSLAFGHHQTSRTLLGTKACCNDRPQTHAGIGKANQAREAKNNERTVWYTYIIIYTSIYIYYTVYYSMAIYDYIWISLSLSVPRRFQSSRGKCFWMFFRSNPLCSGSAHYKCNWSTNRAIFCGKDSEATCQELGILPQ